MGVQKGVQMGSKRESSRGSRLGGPRILLTLETSRFYSIPELENFLNHKAKIVIEIA